MRMPGVKGLRAWKSANLTFNTRNYRKRSTTLKYAEETADVQPDFHHLHVDWHYGILSSGQASKNPRC